MDQEKSGFFQAAVKGQDQAMELMRKLTDVAQPRMVFAEPVSAGDQTVITASEVLVGLGVGYGMGGGEAPGHMGKQPTEAGQGQEAASGVGGGGGGCGFSMARPVAMIVIGPNGVRVEPILDVTKVSLALFTMVGSILVMGAKMRKHR